nr:MAG TPA: hypothetical protein [Caudoviricetes sp.]
MCRLRIISRSTHFFLGHVITSLLKPINIISFCVSKVKMFSKINL